MLCSLYMTCRRNSRFEELIDTVHFFSLPLLGWFFIFLFFLNPALPQHNPSTAVDMLINWNTQMSSLSCEARLCLNLYFYESLSKRSSIVMIVGLKRAAHRAHSSLSGIISNSVLGFVCASQCMYFALTFASVKSAIWSLELGYCSKSKVWCSPHPSLDSQLSQGESLIEPYQVDPTARLSLWRHFESPCDVGLKLVWAVDDGADWWLLILAFLYVERPEEES